MSKLKVLNAFVETWEKVKILAIRKRITISEMLKEIVEYYEKNKT